MSDRKEYRKKWMANRRKMLRLRNTVARIVTVSDSDSDTGGDNAASPCDNNVQPSTSNTVEYDVASNLPDSPSQADIDVSSDWDWDLIDTQCDQDIFSDSDLEDSDSKQNRNLTDCLKAWYVDDGVTLKQLTDLLHILKPLHPMLPLTAETLLQSKHSFKEQCRSLSGGDYIYLGFQKPLFDLTRNNTAVNTLHLSLNIDGVPLFSSSKYSLWPVLCHVVNVKPQLVFVIAVYGGYSKPCDLNFLTECVSELKTLIRDGLTVEGRQIPCTATMCVCDAPARAMVKCVKQFSGYYGCDKCSQKGQFIGRMTYPIADSPIRTDLSFRSFLNEQHHTGSSPFLDLPVDMIAFFPIDYMHQVCLGVTKRLLVCWTSGGRTSGGKQVRLSHSQISQINVRLAAFRSSVNSEFNQKPRSLSELPHWKATEFRTFLLYAAYFALHGIVDDEILNHFMCLSVGIAILVSDTLSADHSYRQFANELLLYFVNKSTEVYGPEFLVYNVHSLVHLSLEVQHFGALDNSSAFIFENFLQQLKKSVRSTKNPVLQVANRLHEKAEFSKRFSEPFVLNCTIDNYQTTSPNNSCILEDGRCCQIVSVNQEDVACMVFSDNRALYNTPCDSRIVGVFRVRLSSGMLTRLPRSTKASKAMSCIGFTLSELLFIQLLHTI